MNINSLLEELTISLEKHFKDNFTGLVLFGSYAQGKNHATSDLDVLIMFDKLPENRLERLRYVEDILNRIEDIYDIPINPMVVNENRLEKTYFMVDIAEYAKILVDKHSVLAHLFDDIKKDYARGFAKKKFVGDHYMLWVSDEVVI